MPQETDTCLRELVTRNNGKLPHGNGNFLKKQASTLTSSDRRTEKRQLKSQEINDISTNGQFCENVNGQDTEQNRQLSGEAQLVCCNNLQIS